MFVQERACENVILCNGGYFVSTSMDVRLVSDTKYAESLPFGINLT